MHLQYCSYPRDPCNCGQLTREAAQQALDDAPRKWRRIKDLETLLREARQMVQHAEALGKWGAEDRNHRGQREVNEKIQTWLLEIRKLLVS